MTANEVRTVDLETRTIERVDQVFRRQRRLTLAYAAVFFLLVLLIPYLTTRAEWWYGRPVWGGLTLNFAVVGVVFHLAYWLMGLAYTMQANQLEDEMLQRPSCANHVSQKGGKAGA